MPDVPRATAADGFFQVNNDGTRSEEEGGEPRVSGSDEPPDHAENDHKRKSQPDDGMVGKQTAGFVSQERNRGGGKEACREEPMEDSRGQISNEEGLFIHNESFPALYPGVVERQVRISAMAVPASPLTRQRKRNC